MEIGGRSPRGLEYRVGHWRQVWRDDRLLEFTPLEETEQRPSNRCSSTSRPAFAATESFERQLRRGVPHWRARIDSASGIDVYGNNGIAVGDIDGDGWDEIYVCQPGGLPNRLYKNRGDGTFHDITERSGLDVLDCTSSALFLDLRNTGRQDLVVLRSNGPLFFLNDGDGPFAQRPTRFSSRIRPQGSFTGYGCRGLRRRRTSRSVSVLLRLFSE